MSTFLACLELDKNYTDTDEQAIPDVESVVACQQLCQDSTTCAHFSYVLKNANTGTHKTCHLKVANTPEDKQGYVSGAKNC